MLTSRNSRIFPSFDDIVFENRNQNYGAYVIRRGYDRRILTGFFITVALLLLITGQSLIRNLFFPEVPFFPKEETVVIVEATPPPIYEIEREKEVQRGERPSGGQKTNTETPMVISNDTTAVAEIPDTTEASSSGKGPGPFVEIPVRQGDPGGSEKGQPVVSGLKEDIKEFVDTMPEFPGGQDALYGFLKSKLKYPRMPLSQGIQSTVYVAFVVRPDGNITDIEVMRPAGYGFDEEVLRVVKKMPRWKPGRMNGENVSVRFRMPIKFRLQK